MFTMGGRCDCGANITKNSVSKSTCEATIALGNHLVYPTYCLLDSFPGITFLLYLIKTDENC